MHSWSCLLPGSCLSNKERSLMILFLFFWSSCLIDTIVTVRFVMEFVASFMFQRHVSDSCCDS